MSYTNFTPGIFNQDITCDSLVVNDYFRNDGDFLESADYFGDGQLYLTHAGKHVFIKEGSNCAMGTATLTTGGEVVVSTTVVSATSRIFLTPQDGSANIGHVWVSARTAATSFTIKSSDVLDTRAVAWIIFKPYPF